MYRGSLFRESLYSEYVRRSEAPDNDPNPKSRSGVDHGLGTTGNAIPIDDDAIRIEGHFLVADRAGGPTVFRPAGGEDPEGKTARTRVARCDGVCPGGAAPRHDFDVGHLVCEEPIEVGEQPTFIGERAGTGNDELKHTVPPESRLAGMPRKAGRAANLIALKHGKDLTSRARSAEGNP